MTPIKVVFFGSGPWAKTTLETLLGRPDFFTVVAVIDNPTADLTATVNLVADVGVVVHYGRILPTQLLHAWPHGVVNIHPSLLPAWRGPSPLQAAILHGDTTTGVSVMVLDQQMDTGPLLAQVSIPLPATAIAQTLYPQLFQLGTELLVNVLPAYISGKHLPVPQANNGSSYSKIIKREDGKILSTDTPMVIDRKFRAYHPWPGIYCIWRQQRIKLTKVTLSSTGELIINEVQPSGKKPMPYDAFLRGRPEFSLSAIE